MNYNLTHIKIVFGLVYSVFFFCTESNIVAQSEYDNHRKYWFYKTRLNNDFIKVGLGDGESIPAQTRGVNNSSKAFSGDPNTFMDWGDATSYLGYYIGVLATEYKLLESNNQNAETVVHELFCALSAVNRLDYKSETPCSAGFVILRNKKM